ncbi:MAG: hypothetical protein WD772_03465, partial [Pseudohongiellaceae bacterium]
MFVSSKGNLALAMHPDHPALESNLHRFVLFRLLFSARFYYPVFTILFLDYGLTLEQFSILN